MLVLLVLSGCAKRTPSQAFDHLAKAAESGDEEALLASMTVDSAALMSSLLHIPRRRSAAMRLGFSTKVRAVSEHIEPDGDLAIVLVETPGPGGERGQVFMRQERGQWKLDLLSTELLWNRRWELSGGEPRGFPDWFEPLPGGAGDPGFDNP